MKASEPTPAGSELEPTPQLLAEARAEIDLNQIDSLTYYGVKCESALTRLAGRVADAGDAGLVGRTGGLLDAMVAQLNQLEAQPRSWLDRLLRRDRKNLEAHLRDVVITIDRQAAELESTSNPLLTETLKLERLATAIQEEIRRLTAYVTAGRQVAAGLTSQGAASHELHHRLQELVTSRAVAVQSLATIMVMVQNRRQLLDRVQYLLNRALPLWHREVEHSVAEAARASEERRALAAANSQLRDAIQGERQDEFDQSEVNRAD